MRKLGEYGLLIVALAVVVGLLSLAFRDVPRQSGGQGDGHLVSRRSAIPAADRALRTERRIETSPNGLLLASSGSVVSNQIARESAADDILLDKVVGELLDAIASAARDKDRKRVIELVEKLRSLYHGSLAKSGLGRTVKRRILDALEGCGPAAIEQILDLLGDSEPEVVRSATELLFDSLKDIKLSDYDRAEIVTAAATEMTDVRSLIRLFGEFVKMRHSVGADAFAQIEAGGTAEAKEQLPRVISAFTGDVTITTAAQLESWLETHPDSQYDNWFYGREPLHK